MRRIRVPAAINGVDQVQFAASWEVLRPLGPAHYIETDHWATTGEPWHYWSFEVGSGLRLTIYCSEEPTFAMVSADAFDAPAILDALRELGLPEPLIPYRKQPVLVTLRAEDVARVTRQLVWLFTGSGATSATAAFARKSVADTWISKHRFSGVLDVQVIDRSRFEIERSWLKAHGRTIPEAEQQAYAGEYGEIYEYQNGVITSGYEDWELWRQDDNGQRFLITVYRRQSEAIAAQDQFEARGHKQTYWVESRPFSGTIALPTR